MAEPMKVCIHCDQEYEPVRKGGIMLHVCPDCRGKLPELMGGSPWKELPSGILMPRDDIRE